MSVLSKQDVSPHRLADLISRDLAPRYLADRIRIATRLRSVTARRGKWIKQLADAIHARYAISGHAQLVELRSWLSRDSVFKRGFRDSKTMAINASVIQQIMQAKPCWDVPQVNTEDELCDLLCLRSPLALAWLVKPHVRRKTLVDHYTRRLVRTSGGRQRWIEQPRPLMKRVQRVIANEILSQIPLHDAAHAYRTGRSARTCASEHIGKRVVLKMDLNNFFGSIPLHRVTSLFRHAGYEYPIAVTLARICSAPAITDTDSEQSSPLRRTRLPQGAPTSPAIANAIAFQLDRRLMGMSRSLDVNYTRYADDLIFSGEGAFAACADRFTTTVAVIAMEEGFQVQYHKTRKMFSGDRQHVLGLNVNERLNTDRRDYEQLKAILTNCVRHGWHSQNRDNHPAFREHLQGRISYIGQTNLARREKLFGLFKQIDWDTVLD